MTSTGVAERMGFSELVGMGIDQGGGSEQLGSVDEPQQIVGVVPTRLAANHDVEFGGKQILKDDQVLMWYVSANRDEDVFENADIIDIERHNADRHLSFGYGIHYCMGSRLAELQLRILWEEILQRFERIEVQDEPTRTLSSFVRGYTHLPVRVTRK